ncbi:unnamed protein product [Timema podura]|uniref:Protein kinase domain-containing protein n=1 Tax=Timema podura TaxID=61482 RepID=A0ABN7NQM3_TIMPD|nr:unnamed protein product [Timema podura]
MRENHPYQTRALNSPSFAGQSNTRVMTYTRDGQTTARRVEQRDVPGIDSAYLAMDTEEGVEVVWNEVQFSERKNFKAQEEKIQQVFENLTQLEHPNIVKFHRYWTDTHNDKPRVIFITEYMSSGSLKQFLKRTKRNVKKLPLQAWKRWCTQILSALSTCTPSFLPPVQIALKPQSASMLGTVLGLDDDDGCAGSQKMYLPAFWWHCVPQCKASILVDGVNADVFLSSYLHSCSPPIIHGNLTCDTIFIQHNGLVKIGSVAPDAIHHHVKTCRDNMKNMHFIAPEYAVSVTPAIDVYSFGMCALEMAALEIQGNGDSGTLVTEEDVQRTIDSLDDESQKDFVRRCLAREPGDRPNARELLFHPLLFEVHPLKLLAAHALVYSTANISETITDEVVQRLFGPDVVVAEVVHADRPGVQMRMGDVPVAEKLEKFVEDVKYGIYPLTAFTARQPPPPRPRPVTPEIAESVKSVTPEPLDVEGRRVVNMMCNVKSREETCELLDNVGHRATGYLGQRLTRDNVGPRATGYLGQRLTWDNVGPRATWYLGNVVPRTTWGIGQRMTILLRMDDKMNRQLTCIVSEMDTSLLLAQELVSYGFINEVDRERVATLIEETLRSCFTNSTLSPNASGVLLPTEPPLS